MMDYEEDEEEEESNIAKSTQDDELRKSHHKDELPVAGSVRNLLSQWDGSEGSTPSSSRRGVTNNQINGGDDDESDMNSRYSNNSGSNAEKKQPRRQTIVSPSRIKRLRDQQEQRRRRKQHQQQQTDENTNNEPPDKYRRAMTILSSSPSSQSRRRIKATHPQQFPPPPPIGKTEDEKADNSDMNRTALSSSYSENIRSNEFPTAGTVKERLRSMNRGITDTPLQAKPSSGPAVAATTTELDNDKVTKNDDDAKTKSSLRPSLNNSPKKSRHRIRDEGLVVAEEQQMQQQDPQKQNSQLRTILGDTEISVVEATKSEEELINSLSSSYSEIKTDELPTAGTVRQRLKSLSTGSKKRPPPPEGTFSGTVTATTKVNEGATNSSETMSNRSGDNSSQWSGSRSRSSSRRVAGVKQPRHKNVSTTAINEKIRDTNNDEGNDVIMDALSSSCSEIKRSELPTPGIVRESLTKWTMRTPGSGVTTNDDDNSKRRTKKQRGKVDGLSLSPAPDRTSSGTNITSHDQKPMMESSTIAKKHDKSVTMQYQEEDVRAKVAASKHDDVTGGLSLEERMRQWNDATNFANAPKLSRPITPRWPTKSDDGAAEEIVGALARPLKDHSSHHDSFSALTDDASYTDYTANTRGGSASVPTTILDEMSSIYDYDTFMQMPVRERLKAWADRAKVRREKSLASRAKNPRERKREIEGFLSPTTYNPTTTTTETPPTSTTNAAILELSTVECQNIAATSRADARKILETYETPLHSDDPIIRKHITQFRVDFLTNFDNRANIIERDQILYMYPDTVAVYYRGLVPTKLSEQDFWERYYYRCTTRGAMTSEEENRQQDDEILSSTTPMQTNKRLARSASSSSSLAESRARVASKLQNWQQLTARVMERHRSSTDTTSAARLELEETKKYIPADQKQNYETAVTTATSDSSKTPVAIPPGISVTERMSDYDDIGTGQDTIPKKSLNLRVQQTEKGEEKDLEKARSLTSEMRHDNKNKNADAEKVFLTASKRDRSRPSVSALIASKQKSLSTKKAKDNDTKTTARIELDETRKQLLEDHQHAMPSIFRQDTDVNDDHEQHRTNFHSSVRGVQNEPLTRDRDRPPTMKIKSNYLSEEIQSNDSAPDEERSKSFAGLVAAKRSTWQACLDRSKNDTEQSGRMKNSGLSQEDAQDSAVQVDSESSTDGNMSQERRQLEMEAVNAPTTAMEKSNVVVASSGSDDIKITTTLSSSARKEGENKWHRDEQGNVHMKADDEADSAVSENQQGAQDISEAIACQLTSEASPRQVEVSAPGVDKNVLLSTEGEIFEDESGVDVNTDFGVSDSSVSKYVIFDETEQAKTPELIALVETHSLAETDCDSVITSANETNVEEGKKEGQDESHDHETEWGIGNIANKPDSGQEDGSHSSEKSASVDHKAENEVDATGVDKEFRNDLEPEEREQTTATMKESGHQTEASHDEMPTDDTADEVMNVAEGSTQALAVEAPSNADAILEVESETNMGPDSEESEREASVEGDATEIDRLDRHDRINSVDPKAVHEESVPPSFDSPDDESVFIESAKPLSSDNHNDEEPEIDGDVSSLSSYELEELDELHQMQADGEAHDETRLFELMQIVKYKSPDEAFNPMERPGFKNIVDKRRKNRKYRKEFVEILEQQEDGIEIDEDRLYCLELYAKEMVGEDLSNSERLDLDDFLAEEEGNHQVVVETKMKSTLINAVDGHFATPEVSARARAEALLAQANMTGSDEEQNAGSIDTGEGSGPDEGPLGSMDDEETMSNLDGDFEDQSINETLSIEGEVDTRLETKVHIQDALLETTDLNSARLNTVSEEPGSMANSVEENKDPFIEVSTRSQLGESTRSQLAESTRSTLSQIEAKIVVADEALRFAQEEAEEAELTAQEEQDPEIVEDEVARINAYKEAERRVSEEKARLVARAEKKARKTEDKTPTSPDDNKNIQSEKDGFDEESRNQTNGDRSSGEGAEAATSLSSVGAEEKSKISVEQQESHEPDDVGTGKDEESGAEANTVQSKSIEVPLKDTEEMSSVEGNRQDSTNTADGGVDGAVTMNEEDQIPTDISASHKAEEHETSITEEDSQVPDEVKDANDDDSSKAESQKEYGSAEGDNNSGIQGIEGLVQSIQDNERDPESHAVSDNEVVDRSEQGSQQGLVDEPDAYALDGNVAAQEEGEEPFGALDVKPDVEPSNGSASLNSSNSDRVLHEDASASGRSQDSATSSGASRREEEYLASNSDESSTGIRQVKEEQIPSVQESEDTNSDSDDDIPTSSHTEEDTTFVAKEGSLSTLHNDSENEKLLGEIDAASIASDHNASSSHVDDETDESLPLSETAAHGDAFTAENEDQSMAGPAAEPGPDDYVEDGDYSSSTSSVGSDADADDNVTMNTSGSGGKTALSSSSSSLWEPPSLPGTSSEEEEEEEDSAPWTRGFTSTLSKALDLPFLEPMFTDLNFLTQSQNMDPFLEPMHSDANNLPQSQNVLIFHQFNDDTEEYYEPEDNSEIEVRSMSSSSSNQSSVKPFTAIFRPPSMPCGDSSTSSSQSSPSPMQPFSGIFRPPSISCCSDDGIDENSAVSAETPPKSDALYQSEISGLSAVSPLPERKAPVFVSVLSKEKSVQSPSLSGEKFDHPLEPSDEMEPTVEPIFERAYPLPPPSPSTSSDTSQGLGNFETTGRPEANDESPSTSFKVPVEYLPPPKSQFLDAEKANEWNNKQDSEYAEDDSKSSEKASLSSHASSDSDSEAEEEASLSDEEELAKLTKDATASGPSSLGSSVDRKASISSEEHDSSRSSMREDDKATLARSNVEQPQSIDDDEGQDRIQVHAKTIDPQVDTGGDEESTTAKKISESAHGIDKDRSVTDDNIPEDFQESQISNFDASVESAQLPSKKEINADDSSPRSGKYRDGPEKSEKERLVDDVEQVKMEDKRAADARNANSLSVQSSVESSFASSFDQASDSGVENLIAQGKGAFGSDEESVEDEVAVSESKDTVSIDGIKQNAGSVASKSSEESSFTPEQSENHSGFESSDETTQKHAGGDLYQMDPAAFAAGSISNKIQHGEFKSDIDPGMDGALNGEYELPEFWTETFDEQSGRNYYFNTLTQEVSWEQPRSKGDIAAVGFLRSESEDSSVSSKSSSGTDASSKKKPTKDDSPVSDSPNLAFADAAVGEIQSGDESSINFKSSRIKDAADKKKKKTKKSKKKRKKHAKEIRKKAPTENTVESNLDLLPLTIAKNIFDDKDNSNADKAKPRFKGKPMKTAEPPRFKGIPKKKKGNFMTEEDEQEIGRERPENNREQHKQKEDTGGSHSDIVSDDHTPWTSQMVDTLKINNADGGADDAIIVSSVSNIAETGPNTSTSGQSFEFSDDDWGGVGAVEAVQAETVESDGESAAEIGKPSFKAQSATPNPEVAQDTKVVSETLDHEPVDSRQLDQTNQLQKSTAGQSNSDDDVDFPDFGNLSPGKSPRKKRGTLRSLGLMMRGKKKTFTELSNDTASSDIVDAQYTADLEITNASYDEDGDAVNFEWASEPMARPKAKTSLFKRFAGIMKRKQKRNNSLDEGAQSDAGGADAEGAVRKVDQTSAASDESEDDSSKSATKSPKKDSSKRKKKAKSKEKKRAKTDRAGDKEMTMTWARSKTNISKSKVDNAKPKSKKNSIELDNGNDSGSENKVKSPKSKPKSIKAKKISDAKDQNTELSTKKPKSKKKLDLGGEEEEAAKKPKSTKRLKSKDFSSQDLSIDGDEKVVKKPKSSKKLKNTSFSSRDLSIDDEEIIKKPKSRKKLKTTSFSSQEASTDDEEVVKRPKSSQKLKNKHFSSQRSSASDTLKSPRTPKKKKSKKSLFASEEDMNMSSVTWTRTKQDNKSTRRVPKKPQSSKKLIDESKSSPKPLSKKRLAVDP